MNAAPGASTKTDVEAARLLLARLGITAEQLLGEPTSSAPVPTFDEYIDRVATVDSAGTRRAYDSYWRRAQAAWGDRRLNEPTPR